MTNKAVRFPFSEAEKKIGGLPYLPLTLSYKKRSLQVKGILDTVSAVNVLPYEIGVKLGADWKQQQTKIKLTGNLANFEARSILLNASVNKFKPVKLAFAWTQSPHVPLILGQMNFFLEFDVCFYASQAIFEIKPKNRFKFE